MITMIEGNSADFDVVVTVDGSPYDLTAHKIWFIVKQNYTDPDVDAIIQCTAEDGIVITDAVNGAITISVTPAKALGMPTDIVLHADVQIRTPAGKVYTVLFEQITVVPRVTTAQDYV